MYIFWSNKEHCIRVTCLQFHSRPIFTRGFVLLYMCSSEIPYYSFLFGFPIEKNLRDSNETVRNSVTAESNGRQILYASVWCRSIIHLAWLDLWPSRCPIKSKGIQGRRSCSQWQVRVNSEKETSVNMNLRFCFPCIRNKILNLQSFVHFYHVFNKPCTHKY